MSNHRQTTSISSDNSTYRPRSPDLSAYILPQQQQQQQTLPLQQNHQEAYRPISPKGFSSHQQAQSRQGSSAALTGIPAGLPLVTHRGSYDASPYFTPQGSFSHQGQQEVQRRSTFDYESTSGLIQSPIGIDPRAGTGKESVSRQQSIQLQGQGLNQQPFTQNSLVFQPSSSTDLIPQPLTQNMAPLQRRRTRPEDTYDRSTHGYISEVSTGRGGLHAARGSKKRRSGDDRQEWTMGRAPGEPGPSLGIDIKTKFPVARIKRIMQADEDVGKVAQAAPTALSKALELFMITLVTKAASEARDRSSKRVTAAHIKQAVAKDQTFDFLQEIIEKVADPTEKKSSGRAGSEDAEEGIGAPTKRKRAARVRKKAGSDDEE